MLPVKLQNGAMIFQDSICILKEKGGKRVKNLLTGSTEELDYWRWDEY